VGGGKVEIQKPGFPLSHHPERLRQQGKKHLKKNSANPKLFTQNS
jgi:hypothetical protein